MATAEQLTTTRNAREVSEEKDSARREFPSQRASSLSDRLATSERFGGGGRRDLEAQAARQLLSSILVWTSTQAIVLA